MISTDWERDSRTTRAPTTTAARTTRRPPLTLPKPENGETDFVVGRKPDEKLQELFKNGEVIVKEEDPLAAPALLPFMKPKVVRFELEKLYKGTKYLQNKVGYRFSVTYSSFRPVPVEVGKSYLITGFAVGHSLYMNECNWFSLWQNLSEVQLLGLRRYYWIYCRCQIRFCPACKPSYVKCNWDPPFSKIGRDKADFLSKEKLCMVGCGRCGWFSPRERPVCN